MFSMGRKQTAALPPITIPNQLLPKRRLSAVERLFFSADATGKHYGCSLRRLPTCRYDIFTKSPRDSSTRRCCPLLHVTPACLDVLV